MSKSRGAQFTPGPWYAANTGNDFQGLVVEEQTGKNIAVAYDKRDVHILAAAPAMYEALQAIEARLQGVFDSPALMRQGILTHDKSADVIRFVRAALAHAEGRQACAIE